MPVISLDIFVIAAYVSAPTSMPSFHHMYSYSVSDSSDLTYVEVNLYTLLCGLMFS
jgi:hypothetical protein